MNNNIEKIELNESLQKNYIPYAVEVILARAIPSIDGLKPSQRKLLYTMYKMGLLKKGKTKSANIVGQTMRLNPHGDQSIYLTMVRMSQGNESLLHPFVASKGNFGKRVSQYMKPAAARYTEAELAPISNLLFSDIEKGEIVPFEDNYDGTMREPSLLPTKLPFIVLNASQGVAVGFASAIPSYNLEEVSKYVIARLREETEKKQVHKYIKGPDFPTGAQIIKNNKIFKSILNNGRGAYTIRAKYRINKNTIEITEIPYTTTIEVIMDRIINYMKQGKYFTEIKDIRDETGLKGLCIAIDIKRGTNVELLMSKLYKKTTLEDNFNCQFNVLIDGELKETNFVELIEKWIEHRLNVERIKLNMELKSLKEKLHRIDGLMKILLNIEEVIKVIRATKKREQVLTNLIEQFDLTIDQAEYIADIKLRNLNKEYFLDKKKQEKLLKKEKKRITKLLKNEKLLKENISNEIEEITEIYKIPRKSQLIMDSKLKTNNQEEFVENYNLKVFLTKEGYFKKIKTTSLRANDEQMLKPNDKFLNIEDGTNIDEVLLFSDKGNVYKQLLSELPVNKASEIGLYLENRISLLKDEKIIYMTVLNKKNPDGYMVFTYKNGKIAKIPLSSYITKTNRKILKKAYSQISDLVSIYRINGPVYITTFRKYKDDYHALTISSDNISEKKSRAANGIGIHKLRKNSECVFSCTEEMGNMYNLKLSTERFISEPNRIGHKLGSTYQTRLLKMIEEN